jgi:hypothetical protein
VKLATHLHLLLSSLPHMPSWRVHCF